MTATMHSGKPFRAQAGFALVTALMALFLITGIAVGMVLMATTETSVAQNFWDQQQSTAAARAGLEEVRDRLRSTATNTLWSATPTALPGAAVSVLYVTNGATQPWLATSPYVDTEICKEGINCATQNASWYSAAAGASTAYATTPSLPWKWVRVMVKTDNAAGGSSRTYSVDGASGQNRVCWNGANETVTTGTSCLSPAQQVYEATALAVTSVGTRRMLQMELAHDPPLRLAGVNLPGAVTLSTTGKVTCTSTGGGSQVSGVDGNAGAPAGSGIAAVAYAGKAGSSCGLSGTITGAAPYNATPSIYSLAMPASLTPGSGLTSTITTIIGQADNIYTGVPPGGANLGTCSGPTWNPMITVIDNPPGTLGVTGCGLLLVQATDDLNLDAMKWQGPVIVYTTKDMRLQVRPGGGGGNMNGALVAVSNNGSDIDFRTQGSGFPINYNSLYLNYAVGKPLRLLAFREVLN